MKGRYFISASLMVVALAALAACGGGDGDGETSGIRTQKGLSVAAITEGLTGAEESNLASGAGTGTSADRQAGAPQLANTGRDTGVASDSRLAGAPLLQQGSDGVTVQGYGSATANADAAIVEFYFSSNGTAIEPQSGRAESGGTGVDAPAIAQDTQEVKPITEADLQPVIDAITGAGVAQEDIQFVGQSYFDKYYSSATLRVTVNNVDAVDGIVQAANNASGSLAGIIANGTNVSYTVNDCAALEEAAMRAAVEDANERAAVFGRALGVGIGSVTGASNYSYFGGTPCDPGFYPGPYPLASVAYAQGQPREVQVIANISVTFAIQ